MTSESRIERLERATGLGGPNSGPPVNVFLPDNGRDPDICSRPDVICYDPTKVPEDASEKDAFFERLRGDRPGVVTFVAVSS